MMFTTICIGSVRSGRWGRKGVAINFVTRDDVGTMRKLESYYNSKIIELPSNFDTGLK